MRRGLSTEGNLRFKIDWASLIVANKFTTSALFYFVFEGNFPSTRPWGACNWRGNLTEGFLRYQLGGLIFGGAYFRNFTVYCYYYYYTLYLLSVFSLAKSLQLILEISATYTLVSDMLADNGLACRLHAQCMISSIDINSGSL